MCPHTSKKKSKLPTKSFRKKKFIKAHTPYPRDHQKKNVVIEPKKKQMPLNLK
jgi:hypothetical protein